jgi:membrane-associated protease RseP (regulator of RpoE activity)
MDTPEDAPAPSALASLFSVSAVETEGDAIRYVGQPLVPPDVLERRVAPLFYERGYEVAVKPAPMQSNGGTLTGQHVLVARPRSVGIDGIPWKNLLLAVLTIGTTLYAGAQLYYLDLSNPLTLLKAWPYSLAVLGILGVHELGHYVASRVYRVDASLPYFIPVPPPFGTMGAIIRMRGRIPSRKALFDIGVAGPIAGFVMTVIVAVIGLHIDPVSVPPTLQGDSTLQIEFHEPILLLLLARLFDVSLEQQFNPVIFASWIGAFVTFLNLIPVGQLDGGHVTRSLLGRRQETLAAAVPAALFGLAGYLYLFTDVRYGITIWIVWGVFTSVFAYLGPATPLRDQPLGWRRRAVGVAVVFVWVLCLVPAATPIRIIAG